MPAALPRTVCAIRRSTCAAVVLGSVLAAPLAWADGSLAGLLDREVVSTASRMAEDASTAPATSTTITAEDIRRYGIHSLDEAINYLSLGMFTQNPLHSVDIGARGVLLTADFGNHVLLLVNGHAVNEQWDGTAYFERGAAVPLELVDHFEIILGPGSVLYGSNAMLGVINIVTKRAKDYSGIHFIAESEIPTSLRGAAGIGEEFRLFGSPAELTFQAEYYAQKGPSFEFPFENYGDDGVTGQPKRFSPVGPGTGIWGGVARNSYYTRIPSAYLRFIVGDFELDMRAATYKRSTPYSNHFNQFSGDFDDPDTTELDRWVSLDLRHHTTLSQVIRLTTRAYADAYDYQQVIMSSAAEDCLEGQVVGCKSHLLGRSRWGGLELQPSFDWAADGRYLMLTGVDARVRNYASAYDYTDRATGGMVTGVGAYGHTETAVGVYAQQTAQPFEPLGLNAGARLDYDSRFGSKTSPRAAATLVPWDKGTLKVVFAEAFRSPTAYETNFSLFTAQIAADHLAPETVRSVEASIEQRFGDHRILFGAFRSWWFDMVYTATMTDAEITTAIDAGLLQAGTQSAVQLRNGGTIDDWGFNAGIDGVGVKGRLHYGLNVTGAYARRNLPDGSQQPITVAPHFFGNARFAYDLANGLPTLAVAGALASQRPADRAFDGGFTPPPFAPTQIDLRATVSGPMPGIRGLSYRLSATYAVAEHSPYVAGPVQEANPAQPAAVLAPVDRFRTAVGLQYDLMP
jgi:outer membrane receptor for ferrienterochelin and colicins